MRLHAHAPGSSTAGREGAGAQIARQWQPTARNRCARMGGILRLSKGRDAGVSDTGVRRASLHPVAQGRSPPSRSCRGCLAFAPRWRLAVAWFQSFCRIHPMNHCELSTNSSASTIDCSTMWKPMLWAALELTRTCAPSLEQAFSAGTLRICCNTQQGRSTMKRSLTWSTDCNQFCRRPCCHTVLSLGL